MVILVVIANIFVLSVSLYSSKGKGYAEEFIKNGTVLEKCSDVNGKIENFEQAIEYIKENDEEFYRIAKKELSYQNLSIIYDYNPIQLYLSIGNGSVYNLSKYLEDNCYSSTQCLNGADRRTKYTTLLANKYYICDKKDLRYVPYGYILDHKIEDTLIYINENYLPIGVIYDSYITKEQFENLSPLEKEDALITSAMIEDTENIKIENNDIQIDIPKKLSYAVKENKINNNKIITTKKNEVIEITIENIPENCELYLNINNLKFISEDNKIDFKVTAKLDDIKNSEKLQNQISSAYYMENPNFLMNLGISRQGQSNKLKVTFDRKGTYTFDNFEILAVSMGKYEDKIDKLKTNVMQEINYGNNYIKGIVNSDKDGILQITTSYSDGWKVYVDGRKQEVFKVNEAFIGTQVQAGYHTIEFKYETPYLKLGIAFSVIGLIIYGNLIVIDRKRKK